MKNIKLSEPIITSVEKKLVMDVLNSGFLASGKQVQLFEEEFAKYIGVKHAVAVSSGTTALHAALIAHGVKQNDKVITTPYSFIATGNAILMCGAKPVFCDIDPKSYNIDPNNVEDILKKDKKVKGMIIVHLYGNSCDINAFNYLSKKYKVFLIEDCAQSVGTEYKNKMTGSFGTGCFSFYATKNMTTAEGGMITTNDEDIALKCRKIINHGRVGRFLHEILGYNYRLTNIAAALGISQLEKLSEFNRKRIFNAEYYSEKLKKIHDVTVPAVTKNSVHVYHQYTILVPKEKRDSLIKYLNDNHVDAAAIYAVTIPEQPLYKNQGYKVCPIAKDISSKVVSLPVHPNITKQEIVKVCSLIENFFRK